MYGCGKRATQEGSSTASKSLRVTEDLLGKDKGSDKGKKLAQNQTIQQPVFFSAVVSTSVTAFIILKSKFSLS